MFFNKIIKINVQFKSDFVSNRMDLLQYIRIDFFQNLKNKFIIIANRFMLLFITENLITFFKETYFIILII
jgi:hypothetical protein